MQRKLKLLYSKKMCSTEKIMNDMFILQIHYKKINYKYCEKGV
jgi:hypothetical protein